MNKFFKIVTGIEPDVDDFFYFEVSNFSFPIFFSKFKTIWSYFRIDFFDFCLLVDWVEVVELC